MCSSTISPKSLDFYLPRFLSLSGIKDKEGLRELFISINILSRGPSPETETPWKHVKAHARDQKDLLGTHWGDWKVDKDKYIHDWLAVPAQEEDEVEDKREDRKEEKMEVKKDEKKKSLQKDRRDVKKTPSVVPKMKPNKKVLHALLSNPMYPCIL